MSAHADETLHRKIYNIHGIFTLRAENSEKRLVKPRDLDIYHEPSDPVIIISRKKPSALQQQVSTVRQMFWKSSDSFRNRYERIAGAISNAEETIKGSYDEVTKDPFVLAKPGLISAAVLVGSLIPGRGRQPFKRLFFSTALGLSVSGVLYPKKAVDISSAGYEKAKVYGSKAINYVREQWKEKPKQLEININDKQGNGSVVADNESELEATPSSIKDEEFVIVTESEIQGSESESYRDRIASSDISHVGEKAVIQDKEQEIAQDSKTNSSLVANDKETKEKPIDLGQSNPEDGDLYSTRS